MRFLGKKKLLEKVMQKMLEGLPILVLISLLSSPVVILGMPVDKNLASTSATVITDNELEDPILVGYSGPLDEQIYDVSVHFFYFDSN